MQGEAFNNSSKKGFTLIEMLIVIVIIGLLAMLAVSSYGSARKRARLDIAVDSIMTTIKEQQNKAKTGRQVGDASSPQVSCYGVYFQKTVPYVQTVTMPYVATPADITSRDANYCDAQNPLIPAILTPLEVSNDIVVSDIKTGGTVSTFASVQGGLVIVFKPPFGTVLEESKPEDIAKDEKANQNMVQIFLNQGDNTPSDQRGVQFDPLSGIASRVLPTTLPSTP